MSSRGWMFTIFNMTWEFKMNKLVKYCVFQKERAETGKLHYQGYLLLASPRKLEFVKKNILAETTAHLETRKGSHEQAKAYCTKSETKVEGPWEHGEEPTQGKRVDIQEMKELIDRGAGELELAEANFGLWSRTYKALDRYKLLKIKPRDFKTEVLWIHGPSGSGKSKMAYEMAVAAETMYYKSSSNKWWDGYEGQEVVVIDDYKGAWDEEYILNLLDRYPFRVEVKGGSVWFNSKKIIITSNQRPARYCTHEPKQLLRRITTTIVLDESTGGTEVSGGNTGAPDTYDSDDNVINFEAEE